VNPSEPKIPQDGAEKWFKKIQTVLPSFVIQRRFVILAMTKPKDHGVAMCCCMIGATTREIALRNIVCRMTNNQNQPKLISQSSQLKERSGSARSKNNNAVISDHTMNYLSPCAVCCHITTLTSNDYYLTNNSVAKSVEIRLLHTWRQFLEATLRRPMIGKLQHNSLLQQKRVRGMQTFHSYWECKCCHF
jgi:hypothetical protein